MNTTDRAALARDARMLAFFDLKACPVPACDRLAPHEAHLNNLTGEVSHGHDGWTFYATKRTLRALPELNRAMKDVRAERVRQHAKWGQQDMADGTGPDLVWDSDSDNAVTSRDSYHRYNAEHAGHLTYRDILLEEVAEAMAEDDADALRAELVQVAAVAVQWVEAIDRRQP